jgi:hypothetical protein
MITELNNSKMRLYGASFLAICSVLLLIFVICDDSNSSRDLNSAAAINSQKPIKSGNLIITQINPTLAKVGSSIVIYGNNFSTSENSIKFYKKSGALVEEWGYIHGLVPTNSNLITVIIPPTITSCSKVSKCPNPTTNPLGPGDYLISVINGKS